MEEMYDDPYEDPYEEPYDESIGEVEKDLHKGFEFPEKESALDFYDFPDPEEFER